MQIYVENRHDYRLHSPRQDQDKILINLEYLFTEDGQRYFPAQTQLTLSDGQFWQVQIEFEEKLKELENGNLLG